MTVTANDGKLIFNSKKYRWERKNGEPFINDKEICINCNKPKLDINGVVE